MLSDVSQRGKEGKRAFRERERKKVKKKAPRKRERFGLWLCCWCGVYRPHLRGAVRGSSLPHSRRPRPRPRPRLLLHQVKRRRRRRRRRRVLSRKHWKCILGVKRQLVCSHAVSQKFPGRGKETAFSYTGKLVRESLCSADTSFGKLRGMIVLQSTAQPICCTRRMT